MMKKRSSFEFKIKSFFTVLTLLVLILSLSVNNSFQVKVRAATELDLKISDLQGKLNSSLGQFGEVRKRKTNLEDEKKAVQSQIGGIDSLIKESESIQIDIKVQLDVLNKDLAQLESQRKELVLQIQKMSVVGPIQDLIASRNFGEVMSKIYTQSTIENTLKQTISVKQLKQAEFDVALKKQEENKKTLEDTKLAKLSKQQELDLLIADYAGNLSKYAQDVSALQKQIDDLEAASKALQQNTGSGDGSVSNPPASNPTTPVPGGGSNPGGVGPIGCWFEDSRSYDFGSDFFGRPTSGLKSQSFGCPSSAGINHDGVDVTGPCGTNIYAAGGGIVAGKGSGNVAGFGNWVSILHSSPSGQRVYTLYAHMQSPSNVGVGATVGKGALVGRMGNTGWATGCHLHFMIYSDTFEKKGHGCVYGSSKCVRPERFISF
ncbi:MAG: peptidoglycan DD-metalloendopeptidase family protein [bacterium]